MTDTPSSSNFLRDLIEADLAAGRYDRVVTRFPPEPNGYLHIGHAKAICADFGLAQQFGGHCNLRMDDTNPTKEDVEYVRAIQEDIRWLGFDWGDNFFHAADYFEQLYAYAVELIGKGLAYVCSQTNEEMRRDRGTVTEPGTPSPDRDRPIEENLDLFARMRAGEFADGELTLRAKIDMAAANMKLRDPPMYRIRHATHHRTGDDWCIYPMYDYAHGLSDSIEGVTHSFCTLEFQNNRALYDWFIDHCTVPQPRPYQHEFARLELSWTVMSKRKLLRLVDDGLVDGWDDPRMPTLSGMRRRGVPPAAIRNFCERIGVAKTNSVIGVEILEDEIRAELNRTALRRMVVSDPIALVVEGASGTAELAEDRRLAFGERLWIQRDDFSEEPPAGWRRLAPGRSVRLRGGRKVTCVDVVKDGDVVTEVRCVEDDGAKVKGTIHWVDAATAVPVQLRLVDRLFAVEDPEAGDGDFIERLNPNSMPVAEAWAEPSLADAGAGDVFQFERVGYFAKDPGGGFNRVVALRDTWAAAPVAEKKPRAVAAPGAARVAASGPSAEELAELERWTSVGVSVETARMLRDDAALDKLAWDAVLAGSEAKDAANLVANELVRALDGKPADALPFGGGEVAALAALWSDGTVNQNGLRAVLAELITSGGEPSEIVARLGLTQLGGDVLAPVVEAVLADHPDEAARLAAGEQRLVGFLLGQVMRRTSGKADPKAARDLLTRLAAR